MRLICLTLIFFANPLLWLIVICFWKPSTNAGEREKDEQQAADAGKGVSALIILIAAISILMLITNSHP